MFKRSLLFSFVMLSCIQAAPTLLILDSCGKSDYQYKSLQELAQSAGFQPTVRSLYQFLENPQIDVYDAVFVIVSPYIFNTNHPISHYYTEAIKKYIQKSNKLVGILLPSLQYSPTTQQKIDAFLIQLLSSEHKQLLQNFSTYLLKKSDITIGSLFGTSLINKTEPQNIPIFSLQSEHATNIPNQVQTNSAYTQTIMPLGFLIQNPQTHTSFFISKASYFTFADIDENFWIMPLRMQERNELLSIAQQSLYELYEHVTTTAATKPLLPPCFSSTCYGEKKAQAESTIAQACNSLYDWIHAPGISCAWLDPFDFFAHEDVCKKISPKQALSTGLNFIYNANFNLLWFEFLPEWYLSVYGIKKEEKSQYVEQIKQLGLGLKELFTAHNKPLPKVFVGMNLTSNFKTTPVVNPVKDILGRVYTKIPSPLDSEHFWQKEVIDVFNEFYTTFNTILPIDGVFFDFEMYHAQDQAGTYTDLMDFSDLAWNIYCAQNPQVSTLVTHEARITYLRKSKQFTAYFKALEKEAMRIGIKIKESMRQHNKDLLFAAYAPTLPDSWFYRGIMHGLSSPTEPLILATFNIDYYSHHDWFIKNNIHVIHGSALMLSKLKEAEDFDLIHHIKKHHYFVWYNRPSRMIYGYSKEELDKVWWGIEASSLSTEYLAPGIALKHK